MHQADSATKGKQHNFSDAAATDEGESQPLLRSGSDSHVDSGRKRLISSCVGFLADAYDLFTIDLVLLILGLEYGKDATKAESQSLMVSTMLVGIIIGQLSFGYVADLMGRKWTFVATAGLAVVGALLSACVIDVDGGFGLPLQLALCRLLLGLGIGGEYPLSASVTAESAEDPAERGFMLATVISMQGWGMLLSSCIALIALWASASLETIWRLLLAFGAVPSSVAFVLRWQLHESSSFSKAAAAEELAHQQSQGGAAAAIPGGVLYMTRRHWTHLLGTASTWFLMNCSLYSLGSFKSQVLNDFISSEGLTDRQKVSHLAAFAALTSGFAILGFTAALLLINRVGRYLIQFMGFVALAVIFSMLMVLSESTLKPPAWIMIVLLGSIFFFMNLGPNTTTYIISAEIFPTLMRATCHGVSAASGKVGALLGAFMFPHAEARYGMGLVYAACAIAAILGAISTYFFTPRCPCTLASIDEGLPGSIS